MRAFGAQAHVKCSAEAELIKLVAATQQVKGDPDSEVDREVEWMASHRTKGMLTKAMQKGLDGVGAGLTWMHVQAKKTSTRLGAVEHKAGRVGKTVQDKCLCQRIHLIPQRADMECPRRP